MLVGHGTINTVSFDEVFEGPKIEIADFLRKSAISARKYMLGGFS
jgi:hypothetical protein